MFTASRWKTIPSILELNDKAFHLSQNVLPSPGADMIMQWQEVSGKMEQG